MAILGESVVLYEPHPEALWLLAGSGFMVLLGLVALIDGLRLSAEGGGSTISSWFNYNAHRTHWCPIHVKAVPKEAQQWGASCPYCGRVMT